MPPPDSSAGEATGGRSAPIRIRRLAPVDAAAYRALMLAAYASEPEAFTSTVREREPLPLKWWLPRVSDEADASQLVLGAFDGERLVGVAGLAFEGRPRTAHKAKLFGMFVLDEHRGRGLGRRLVEAVLDAARSRPGTEIVQLTVTESNEGALRLYEACGFVAFGTEPFANKLGDRYVSLLHMWRAVGSEPV